MKFISILLFCMSLVIVNSAIAKDNLSDGEIVAIYNQMNSFDIEKGLLAAHRAKSSKVRALGKMVAENHNQVRQAVTKIASELWFDVALPKKYNDEAEVHYDLMAGLLSAAPAEFDRMFLLADIKFHTETVRLVETVFIPAVQSPELRAHLQEKLPNFKHHLHHTKELAQQLGVID